MRHLSLVLVIGLSAAAMMVVDRPVFAGDSPAAGAGEAWVRTGPHVDQILGPGPLEQGFRNPPRSCSIVPLWSWNGRLEPDQIRWQIDQMVDKGVYGAFMHARAGIDTHETPYFSEGWWQAVAASVEHAAKVGFAAWLYDEDAWPSGSAGGRTLKANPTRNQRKELKRSTMRVTGPRPVELKIPDAQYVIAGKQVSENTLDGASLVDATKFNGGPTPWPCPPGDWLIIGYVYRPVQKAEGVINYLNKQTIRDFMDITYEAYAQRVGGQFGQAIPGVFFDEIHNSGADVVWAEGLPERFQATKGYDLIPLLPALSLDIGRQTPQVRCDYYDVYTSIYEEAWFKQIADWCDAHHLMLTGHTVEEIGAYTTQGDYFRTMRHLHIPATDNEDFRYSWPRVIGAWKPKQIASVCHLYGRPLVGVEAMGGAGWSFTPDSARYGFNMLAACGINFFIPHLFHYAEDRPENMDDWPNSWFFRNPFWKYFKTLSDHASRLTYMLTGTEHVVDVAVLFPTTNLWAGNGGGSTVKTLDQLTAQHIDADLMDGGSLVRAAVADQCLVVGTMRYRVLVLPGVRCLRRDEARKIGAFLAAGGLVIVHDRWPSDSMDAGKDDPHIAQLQKEAEARGVKLSSPDQTARLIGEAIERDVVVSSDDAEALRYHHIRRDHKDVYWLANSAAKQRTWQVSFRAVGTPAIWQPEDGSITAMTAFVRRGHRTECGVTLDGWQGCFVVFDPSTPPPEGGIAITATNLEQPTARQTGENAAEITGWLPPEPTQAQVKAMLHQGDAGSPIEGEQETPPAPRTISLAEGWRFLPAGDQLDEAWRVDLDRTELAVPVMRMRWERDSDGQSLGWHFRSHDDRGWRLIKVLDTLHPTEGADRYRSRWQGRFISYYDDRLFQAPFGGKGLQCRKPFDLPEKTRVTGWLAVVCQSPFRVTINDHVYPGKGSSQPQRFELRGLKPGKNMLTIAADNAPAILAEGQLILGTGQTGEIFTDVTWEVSLGGKTWRPAWEYVAPPEKPYGEPRYPQEIPLPHVVWYRQPLPPGTVAIHVSGIEGDWTAWVDGKPLTFDTGWAKLPPDTPAAVLALQVKLAQGQHGLVEPVRVRCEPSVQPLGSWTQRALDWYSGRATYSATFQLDPEHLRPDVRLQLDLGKVGHCAEIWLNGKLAATRLWPPYRTDITGSVQPGQNRIDIVVANLLANRMHWDIFDDVKGVQANRRWHDGNLRRDAWCFESGLIGPVRIIPMRQVTVTARSQ